MKSIKLGQKVKDKVTGFTGIAVAKCKFLNGCVQFHISPPVDKDGNERKDQWIDAAQLEIIDNGILSEPKPKSEPKNPVQKDIEPVRKYGGGGFRSHPV